MCHLKDVCKRKHADKGKKPLINVGDELLNHAFKAHLLAGVTTYLHISSPADPIHSLSTSMSKDSISWLKKTAEEIVSQTVVAHDPPVDLTRADHVYLMNRRLLYMGFLYHHLRESIKREDGPRIISSWRYWLILFLGGGKKNYSSEAANLLSNLKDDWSKSMAYVHTNNRTVNMSCREGGASIWIN